MNERSTRCPPRLRILSAVLAVAMMLTLLPVTAFAADRTEIVDGVQYYQMNGLEVWWVTGTYSGNATDLTIKSQNHDKMLSVFGVRFSKITRL